MPDEHCRLAKAEVEVDLIQEDIRNIAATREAYHREQSEKMDLVIKTLQSVEHTQSSQSGFVGGVVFTVCGLFAVIIYVLRDKLGAL